MIFYSFINPVRNFFDFFWFKVLFAFYVVVSKNARGVKLNLASGYQAIPGYLSCDVFRGVDLRLDMSKAKLPFSANSLSTVVCTSAINYITYEEARSLIRDIYRALETGGVCRMSVQDLDLLVKYYYENNEAFFNQLNSDGTNRFPGHTIADKFNNWFHGFYSNGHACKYVYNFESLKELFVEAGFKTIERRSYLDSRLANIDLIDNRADQMFFLEAVK